MRKENAKMGSIEYITDGDLKWCIGSCGFLYLDGTFIYNGPFEMVKTISPDEVPDISIDKEEV